MDCLLCHDQYLEINLLGNVEPVKGLVEKHGERCIYGVEYGLEEWKSNGQ